jgi:hypothetical protein
MMAYVGAVARCRHRRLRADMGIGVDSNVLIFERIKEEIEASRGVRVDQRRVQPRLLDCSTPTSRR